MIKLLRTKADLYGTHGKLVNEAGELLCYTIERPWLGNKHDFSCIPEGIYECVPHVKSNNGQKCWLLRNVPGRSGILIHTGNTDLDSEGCIIVGLMSSESGVLESELALAKLQGTLPKTFILKVESL